MLDPKGEHVSYEMAMSTIICQRFSSQDLSPTDVNIYVAALSSHLYNLMTYFEVDFDGLKGRIFDQTMSLTDRRTTNFEEKVKVQDLMNATQKLLEIYRERSWKGKDE